MKEIRCFGIAKDIVKGDYLLLNVEDLPRTVGAFKIWLAEKYPAFKALRHYAIGVNQTYAEDDHLLEGSDEIVIIPPVSGG